MKTSNHHVGLLPWILIIGALVSMKTGCRTTRGGYVRTGPHLKKRDPDCTLELFRNKMPKGEVKILGKVEAELTLHFFKGTASFLRVLPLLKAQACKLGANAIVGIRERYFIHAEYTTMILNGSAVWVTRPVEPDVDERALHRVLTSISALRGKLLRCTNNRAAAFVLLVDGSGRIKAVKTAGSRKDPSKAIEDCVLDVVERIFIPPPLRFRAIPLLLSP